MPTPLVIKLSIDTFSAVIGNPSDCGWVPDSGHIRDPRPSGDTSYSLLGTPIDDGDLFAPKQIWQLKFYTTPALKEQIQMIWLRSERKRAAQSGDYSILVEDYIDYYLEDAITNTRALATGASVLTVPGSGIKYAAKYKARMFEPKFSDKKPSSKFRYLVALTLKELDLVPA